MEMFTYLLHEYMLAESKRQKVESIKLDAIANAKQSLDTAIEQGNETSEVQSLINLGNIYAYYDDFGLSDTMYRRALALARQIEEKSLEVLALLNLGLSYKQRADFEQAYAYYNKAKQISKETGNKGFEQKIDEHISELANMIDIDDLSKGTK